MMNHSLGTTDVTRLAVKGHQVNSVNSVKGVYNTQLRGQVVEITGHVSDLSSLDFGDKLASLKVEGVCRWEIFQGESQTSHQTT